MTQVNLRKSVFQVAPNHNQLLMPGGIQGKNERVMVAIRFYGVKGAPTIQGKVLGEDGVEYYLIIGQFLGTEVVEQVEGGERYAPLQGHLQTPLHLPKEATAFVGETFPIPPELNINFLLSSDDVDLIEDISIGNGIGARTNEFQGGSQNSWVIRVEMDLYQTVTILSPSTRDAETGKTDGFHHIPSILLKEPVKLVTEGEGQNIMGYSQFGGDYPYSRLTSEELTHPIVSFFNECITYSREYGYSQSVVNGSRANGSIRRNKNLGAFPSGRPARDVNEQRTDTPTTPSNFMDEEEPVVVSSSTRKLPSSRVVFK